MSVVLERPTLFGVAVLEVSGDDQAVTVVRSTHADDPDPGEAFAVGLPAFLEAHQARGYTRVPACTSEVRGLVARANTAKARKALMATPKEPLGAALAAVFREPTCLSMWPVLLKNLAGNALLAEHEAWGQALRGALAVRPAPARRAILDYLSKTAMSPIAGLEAELSRLLEYDGVKKHRELIVAVAVAGHGLDRDGSVAVLRRAASDDDPSIERAASAALKAMGETARGAWDDCPLALGVVRHLRRLGATWTAPADPSPTLDGEALPAPLRAWREGLTFPNRSYANTDSDRVWVWSCTLGGFGLLDKEEARVTRPSGALVTIGYADGGNDMVVMLLESPDPRDPLIGKVDHDDSDQHVSLIPASTWLASLRVE